MAYTIEQAYYDLFGLTPDAEGLAYWTNRVIQSGVPFEKDGPIYNEIRIAGQALLAKLLNQQDSQRRSATTQLTATSELDAVNIMLGTIGEAPINSLEAATGVVDAVSARSVLAEVTLQVQEEGWHFNTDYEFVLTPTADTGEIFVATNVIEIDCTPYDPDVDVAIRGNRLYDRNRKTYSFTKPLKADLTVLLPFNELPQAARHYITIRAARVFQQRMVGSETLGNFTEKDEARAQRAMQRYEARTADYNMLTSNFSVMRVIDR